MLEFLDRQARLTVNHWKIIAALALGGTLGSSSLFLAGFALGYSIAAEHPSYGQSPLINWSTGVGTILGAVFWGWMADRIGRRTAFIATLLNVSLATGVMAFTPNQGAQIFLTIFFFFGGLGASGLFVVLVPLVQEFLPSGKRGLICGVVIALVHLGGAGLLPAARLAQGLGWRALYAVTLLPALLTLLIGAWVPESPHWLIRKGRPEDSRRSLGWVLRLDPKGINLPATLPETRSPAWHELFKYPRSVVVTCLTSLSQIGGLGVALWAGVFMFILKISWDKIPYLVLGIGLSGLAGQFAMSYLSDAIGRRRSGILCGFGGALALALAGYFFDAFVGTVSVFWLLAMVAAFFGIGSLVIIWPYAAEAWPVGLRASGMGLAYGTGTLGASLAPLGLGLIIGAPSFVSPQATSASVLPATLFLAGWYALAGFAWLFATETRGRSIEEIDAALARPYAAGD